MKIRFCAALLLAALAIPIFAGCASADAMQQPAAAPEIKISTETAPKNTVPEPTPAATPAATGTSHTLPTGIPQLLSKEKAEKIALEHAGFTADQVQRLRTELDYDRGKPEYEVDFHHGGYEYDYEIDAESGNILSWDKDRED